MTFKDTKYLFTKTQLSFITTALTDNLELPAVLSPNFALLDVIVDVPDRVKTMASLQHILDLKR